MKRLQKQAWTCSRCLLGQTSGRRSLVGVASSAITRPQEELPPIYHNKSGIGKDDDTLRRIFDSKPFWKDFSQRGRATGKRAGLLQNRYLTSPAGFQQFSEEALQKCRKLVKKIMAASTLDDYRNISRDMDRLSDMLCRVIDLVDFIRSVHPDPHIQRAASQAHALMFEFMNILNTTTGLNDRLEKALGTSEVINSWTEEEKIVARILHEDFAQSALKGTDEIRQKFVQVSSQISQLGTAMVENMEPAILNTRVKSEKLQGMDPTVVKPLNKGGICRIPSHGFASTLALRTVEDEGTRERLYMASRTASHDSIGRVEELVRKRAELANLAGFETFAHMTLKGKMAKSPEAVNSFLEALAADNKIQINNDMVDLLALKDKDSPGNSLKAWDRDYYTTRLRDQMHTAVRPHDILSSYFSLGTVMQGLSRLFDRLYGIRLVPHETLPGETWNDDVRRLDVIDESEGLIAVVYCDLFQRPNKSPNPAHFTLRCSRLISAAEIAESSHLLPADATPENLSAILNDGMATSVNKATGQIHQLPTIALICDFPSPTTSFLSTQTPTLLSFNQLSTLFHEMGHALHSILGRTTLQNVAGTRCATDFAELPSILMEHFASCPAVLALYARHYATDAPLDPDLVTQSVAIDKRLADAADTEAQILLAVLDQRFHGLAVSSAVAAGTYWDSSATYQAVWNDARFASVAEPAGTSWHGFFGHLFGYGAVYYSYLFDRAIAGKVFKEVFAGEAAVDRARGQRYRDEVLKWGGGRDGWACVAGVLGERYAWMKGGGAEAMREVGRWGARA